MSEAQRARAATVRTEQRAGVGWLLLDRPRKAHAYDSVTLQAVEAAFDDLASRGHVVVIASTGQGAFCGGADLDEMAHAAPEHALDLPSHRLWNKIADAPVVTLAVIQGAAIGGGFELALACDLRVVGPKARFALPETSLGLIPAAGGCTRLPRLVGESRARAVILGGFELDAETAVAWGLATEVSLAPHEAAQELALRVMARDATALRMAKAVLATDTRADASALERTSEAVLYSRRAGRTKPAP